ncbi:MAG: hypothetical protein NW217_08465 [Hyphomicrobiaceae bacterium]|nr:hypothetical protein [Hyphomicrobiaceae bacterium]
MKILAVRLAGVGRFAEPVAIEGFSGGLDVLAGPNEMGKSTIFRALREVFATKHKATSKDVRRLVTEGSVAVGPLIEADFDVAGRRYRITKRFHKTQRAELSDLDAGKLVARGAEADDELALLLGLNPGNAGRLGVLWIGQSEALGATPPTLDTDARTSLMRAVEAEVADFTGGGLAARVRARVADALEQQVTTRGPRRGGAYDRLLRERDEAMRNLAEAQTKAARTEERRQAFADVRNRLDLMSARDRQDGLREAARAAKEALAGARAARENLGRARERARQQETEVARARDRLATLSGAADRMAAASARLAIVQGEITSVTEALALATAARETCRLDGEVAAADEQRWLARARRAAVAARLTEKSRVLDAARKLEAEIGQAAAVLTADPATSQRISALEMADREMTLAADRLLLQSTEVCVHYVPTPAARVRAGARELADGESLKVTAPLALDIAGVGRIDLRPGSSPDRDAIAERLGHARAETSRLLAEIGATDLNSARAAHARRKACDEGLQAAIAQLRGIAPDGVATLRADLAGLSEELAAIAEPGDEGPGTPDGDSSVDPSAIDVRVREASRRVSELRERYRSLSQDRDGLVGRHAALTAEAAGLAAQSGELSGMLGPLEDRAERLQRCVAEVAAAQDATRETGLILAALVETAPDESALERLTASELAARQALADNETEVAGLKVRLAALTGELTVSDEAGIGLRVGELEGELARVSGELSRMESDIAALRLLDEALAAARQETSSRITEPVARRLVPYLDRVLKGAQVEFDAALLPVALRRGNAREGLDQLSEGTQEQLAVLTRLAYGRLLAETGEAAPVILDDPFAYSDETRLGHMFDVLADAATAHQVIVLTCRESLFEPLHGHRLSLRPWQPPSL